MAYSTERAKPVTSVGHASVATKRVSTLVSAFGGPSPMLPTEDLFVHLCALVDDAITDKVVAIPTRPGPVPACSDAEVHTVALARHVLDRRSEAGC